ncbi:hypothetical protein FRC00_012572 [Tulasnella sp. 408]|nr:hypothetical protein FRC00_012572 [Tulasnella sp. 408]
MEDQPLIPSKQIPTPLPKRQLAIILFARLAEPIAYTQIFPYIAQMVEELHIASDKKKIGFYAGLITKPMKGKVGGELPSLQGLLTGVLDARTALPLLSATYATGAIVGPLIGGLLSHPAERYPNVFGKVELLRRKTLPSIVKTKGGLKNSGVEQDYGTIDANAVKPENQPPTARQLLSDPLVRRLVMASFAMASLGLGFDALFVLFAYTPIGLGGLGRQDSYIRAYIIDLTVGAF